MNKINLFVVKINDKLVYSKLEQGAFPDFDAIVQQVVNAFKGQEVNDVVEKDASSSCSIL